MLQTWRAMKLWKRVFIGLALGAIVGTVLHYTLTGPGGLDSCDNEISLGQWVATEVFQPLGKAFVNLIKMLVVPLIATTLVSGIVAMGDPKRIGSLGAKTIAMYLMTTFFAVWLGILIATLIQPGNGMEPYFSAASACDIDSVADKLGNAEDKQLGWVDYLVSIIPTNPVEAYASTGVLQIIFFSIFLGVGILLAGDKGKPMAEFFDSASEVVMKITLLIMELAPYGVLFLMAWVLGDKGFGILGSMGKLAIALYIACFLQIIFVYGGLIVKTILRLPLVRFFYGISDALGVAYSTASSNATLPVSISCAEHNLGIDKSVAGSVLPMGATINMDGTAIYLGMVALFAAQALPYVNLEMADYFMIAMMATMTSIGAAGVPSAGLLLAAGVLTVVGVSPEDATLIIAFIFPFDRILDMMRTATNVTGDLAIASTVAKWEGELDEKVFKKVTVH